MRTKTQPQENQTFNLMGTAYRKAKRVQQLSFKAALMEAGERDGADYWRAFRDNWQHSDSIGKAPFVIVATAIDKLNFNVPNRSGQL